MNKLEVENKLKDNKLPERWEKIRLGEIIVENIKSRSKVEDADNYGRYPFFTSGEAILSDSNYLVDYENVFLTTGGVANIKYYEGKANYSADTYCLKAKITTKYLYYFLLKNLTKINYKYFSGSGLKHLQKNDFKKEILIFPFPLHEQEKIAEILETVDKTIEKTDAIIEKYKRIKQGLMQDLLTKGIDENGHIRSEETHKFKDSPLGRIPEEWEMMELGKVGNIIYGGRLSEKDYDDYGRVKVFGTGGVIAKTNKIMDRGEAIILPRKGTINNKYYVEDNEEFWVIDTAYYIKAITKTNLKYVFYFLDKVDFNLFNEATGVPSLNRNTLKSIVIPLPLFPEQRRIASILSQIDETIEKEQNYKEKLERIKQGLMEDLLTGKVRVNHLIKEGAESVQKTG